MNGLSERFPAQYQSGLRRPRLPGAVLADARHADQVFATVEHRPARALPGWNAPLLQKLLERAPRPAGVRLQPLPAFAQAYRHLGPAELRDAQTTPFLGLEFEHATQLKQR